MGIRVLLALVHSHNSLWYELQGDYHVSCLTLGEEDKRPIGRRGRKHQKILPTAAYIQKHPFDSGDSDCETVLNQRWIAIRRTSDSTDH